MLHREPDQYDGFAIFSECCVTDDSRNDRRHTIQFFNFRNRSQGNRNIATESAARHRQVRAETDGIFRELLESLRNPLPDRVRDENHNERRNCHHAPQRMEQYGGQTSSRNFPEIVHSDSSPVGRL